METFLDWPQHSHSPRPLLVPVLGWFSPVCSWCHPHSSCTMYHSLAGTHPLTSWFLSHQPLFSHCSCQGWVPAAALAASSARQRGACALTGVSSARSRFQLERTKPQLSVSCSWSGSNPHCPPHSAAFSAASLRGKTRTQLRADDVPALSNLVVIVAQFLHPFFSTVNQTREVFAVPHLPVI